MTTPDSVIFNTLERLVATDLNRVGGLAGKGTQDLAAAIEGGIQFSPRSCTRRGLGASPGAGLAVDIAAGELMAYDATIAGPEASGYKIGRLEASATLALAAADVAFARIDTIYGIISQELTDGAEVRIELQLPARTLSAATVNKSSRPALELGVATGTPGVPPAFDGALPAGAIALWHVYVPANATVVDPAHLMDGRIRFLPNALARKHGRDWGLFVSYDPNSAAQMVVTSGRAYVDGALVEVGFSSQGAIATFFPTGSGVVQADTEYDAYLIGPGMGPSAAIGAAVPYVVVLVSGNPPDGFGRPTSPLSFRPLPGIDDAVTRATLNALYIGTVHTDGSSLLQLGGDGIPLSANGQVRTSVVSPTDNGFAGQPSTWWRRPVMRWVNATSIAVDAGVPVLRGTPGVIRTPLVGALPGSLMPGEVESASTFYYVYLRTRLPSATQRSGSVRSYVLVMSSFPPDIFGRAPNTPPFDAQDFLYVGSVYNDASSNIVEFVQDGPLTRWVSSVFVRPQADIAVAPLFTTVQAVAPATARSVYVGHGTLLTAAGASNSMSLFVYGGMVAVDYQYQHRVYNQLTGSMFRNDYDHVLVNSLGQYRVQRNALAAAGSYFLDVTQYGYTEMVDSPTNPFA